MALSYTCQVPESAYLRKQGMLGDIRLSVYRIQAIACIFLDNCGQSFFSPSMRACPPVVNRSIRMAIATGSGRAMPNTRQR